MDRKDIDCLMRAKRVSANYERRITDLEARLEKEQLEYITSEGITKALKALQTADRLAELRTEYAAHTARVKALRKQHQKRQAINKLCADTNKLAGTDGLNFSTKASNALKEQAHEQHPP